MVEIRSQFDAFFEVLEDVARCFEELVVAIKEAIEKLACEFREAFMLHFSLYDVEYRGNKTCVLVRIRSWFAKIFGRKDGRWKRIWLKNERKKL